MKKLVCIVMAVFHLLSIAGGYWLFYGLEVNNKTNLARELDADNYAGSQTITIRLPLSLAHTSSTENYERVDGEFEYEGATYRLIKQKFYKDSVYMVCYLDNTGNAISDAMTDYVGSHTDKATDTKSNGKTANLLIKDYVSSAKVQLSYSRSGIDSNTTSSRYQNFYIGSTLLSVDQPPELIG